MVTYAIENIRNVFDSQVKLSLSWDSILEIDLSWLKNKMTIFFSIN